jgi:hypothetical protein
VTVQDVLLTENGAAHVWANAVPAGAAHQIAYTTRNPSVLARPRMRSPVRTNPPLPRDGLARQCREAGYVGVSPTAIRESIRWTRAKPGTTFRGLPKGYCYPAPQAAIAWSRARSPGVPFSKVRIAL